MTISITDAKKLADQFNIPDLILLMEASDELMRVVMEVGDLHTAEDAAQVSADFAAALVVHKEGIRKLAERVRRNLAQNSSTIPSK